MPHDKATVWYTRFVSTTDSITAGFLEKGGTTVSGLLRGKGDRHDFLTHFHNFGPGTERTSDLLVFTHKKKGNEICTVH